MTHHLNERYLEARARSTPGGILAAIGVLRSMCDHTGNSLTVTYRTPYRVTLTLTPVSHPVRLRAGLL